MSNKTVDEVFTSLIRLKYPDYPLANKDSSVAGELGLKAQSFSNYKNGKRAPNETQANMIAREWIKALGPFDEVLRQRLSDSGFSIETNKLAVEIKGALLRARVKQESTLLDTVLGGSSRTLVLSYLNYGVFSNGRRGLFDRICKRFFNHLGVEPVPIPRKKFKREMRGETQVAQCYFATPSRAHATFLPFPLRVSLGAVASIANFSNFKDVDWPRLARSIYLPSDDPTQTTPIRPIVVKDEVGHLHCRHTLGYERDDERMVIIDEMVEEVILDKLLNTPIDKEGRIPVLIIDEYTALRVRAIAGASTFLAVPITGSRTNRHSVFRRELPQYYMSLACPVQEQKFAEFLERSLGQFFYTELETTSRVMADTFFALEQEVFNATAGLGSWSNDYYDTLKEEWKTGDYNPALGLTSTERRIISRAYALYTMSLDRLTIEDPTLYPAYWQRILRRTREIVQYATVSIRATTDQEKPSGLRDETRMVIRSTLNDTESGQARVLRSGSQLQVLNDYTDHVFDINQCRGQFEEELLAIVESRLCSPAGLNDQFRKSGRQAEDIEVVPLDPRSAPWTDRTSFEVNGILELLNQLAQMYYKLPDPLPLPLPDEQPRAKTTEVETDDVETLGDNTAKTKTEATETEGRQIFSRIESEVRAKFQRYAQILLAVGKTTGRDGSEKRHHAGVIFILAEPGVLDRPPLMAEDLSERAYLEQCCELRYLWVASPYRGRNVSRLLLVDALEWCRTKGYKHARVAILPPLEEAIARINNVHFKPVQALKFDKLTAPRRLIFEANLDANQAS